MKKETGKRQSHCTVCGTRLSLLMPSGDIQWKPSFVDDKGLYCAKCYKPKGKSKSKK